MTTQALEDVGELHVDVVRYRALDGLSVSDRDGKVALIANFGSQPKMLRQLRMMGDDMAANFVESLPPEDSILYIRNLDVDPGERHHGHGGRALDMAIDEARRQGVRHAILFPVPESPDYEGPLVALYEKHGFVREVESDDPMHQPDLFYRRIDPVGAQEDARGATAPGSLPFVLVRVGDDVVPVVLGQGENGELQGYDIVRERVVPVAAGNVEGAVSTNPAATYWGVDLVENERQQRMAAEASSRAEVRQLDAPGSTYGFRGRTSRFSGKYGVFVGDELVAVISSEGRAFRGAAATWEVDSYPNHRPLFRADTGDNRFEQAKAWAIEWATSGRAGASEPDHSCFPCGLQDAQEAAGRRKKIRIDKLIVKRSSLRRAFDDVVNGELSMTTKEPISVHYMPEYGQQPVKGYLLTDGHHRLVQQMLVGPSEPWAWLEIDVRQVASGYTDYWVTPRPEDRVVFTNTRYGGLESVASLDELESVAEQLISMDQYERSLGASEDRAPRSRHTTTSLESYAATFLSNVESVSEDADPRDFHDDPRVETIVATLRALGLDGVGKILGAGTFGTAALLDDDTVIKLTSDPTEVQAGHVLRGRRLKHVARIHESWFLRDVKAKTIVGKTAKGKLVTRVNPCGLLYVERVQPIADNYAAEQLTEIVNEVKEYTHSYPHTLARLDRAQQREKLKKSSRELEKILRDTARQLRDAGSEDAQLAEGVADALKELRDNGVYAIDVHAGNIGYVERGSGDILYKVFDVGSSSPPARPKAEVIDEDHVPQQLDLPGMFEEGVGAAEEIGAEYKQNPTIVDAGAEETSSSTWYHLTDRARFKLDPKCTPADNAFAIEDRSGRPGIYLGRSVESWVNGFGYWRPFVVEFKVDPSVMSDPGVHGRWSDEMFVPASSFDKLTIQRVIPLDAYAREEFGEPGWIESGLGVEFDTGDPVVERSRKYKGYRYPGPDVRTMASADVARLKKQLRQVKGGGAEEESGAEEANATPRPFRNLATGATFRLVNAPGPALWRKISDTQAVVDGAGDETAVRILKNEPVMPARSLRGAEEAPKPKSIPKLGPQGHKFAPVNLPLFGDVPVVTGYTEVRAQLEKHRKQIPSAETITLSVVFSGLSIMTGIEQAEEAFACVTKLYEQLGRARLPTLAEIQHCIVPLGLIKQRSAMYETAAAWAPIVRDAMKRGLRDRELRRFLYLESELPVGIGLAKLSFVLSLCGQDCVCLDARLLGRMYGADGRRVSSSLNTQPARGSTLDKYEAIEDAFLDGNPFYDPKDPIGRARAQWQSWEQAGKPPKPAAHSVWLSVVR